MAKADIADADAARVNLAKAGTAPVDSVTAGNAAIAEPQTNEAFNPQLATTNSDAAIKTSYQSAPSGKRLNNNIKGATADVDAMLELAKAKKLFSWQTQEALVIIPILWLQQTLHWLQHMLNVFVRDPMLWLQQTLQQQLVLILEYVGLVRMYPHTYIRSAIRMYDTILSTRTRAHVQHLQ